MPISRITGASIEDGSITLADLGITTIDSGTGNTLTLQANSRTGITIDVTGNTAIANTLSFTGTGARIRGDMSNATIASRVMFQNSTTDAVTVVSAIPNGTATQTNLEIYNKSDPNGLNSPSLGQLLINSSELSVRSTIRGSGTYLPMTFHTGGSERLRIDTSGNVGIGTANPSSSSGYTSLTVNNATNGGFLDLQKGGTTYLRAEIDGSNNATLGSATAALRFQTNNVERMRISNAGNIGIGTTSPSQLLHVAAGTILSSNTAGTIATVSIAGNGSTVGTSDFALQQGTSSEAYVYNRANSYLALGTNNTERMRITAGGNVGIGTNNPVLGLLDINGAGSTLAVRTPDTSSPTLALFVNAGSNGVGTISVDNGGIMTFDTGSTGAGQAERMRITSGGNVGIGTTGPLGRLDISSNSPTTGNFSARIVDSGSYGCRVNMQSSSTNGRTYEFGVNYHTGIGEWAITDSSSTHIVDFYVPAASGYRALYTNGSERMRIDSAGDVGIGTTNPVYQLHIQSGDPRIALTNTTYGEWFTSAGWTGANDYSIVQAGTAERMRLDSSGNLRFNSGYGSVANAYGCRAWVNFNGQTNPPTIRGSGNVSSITDLGVGRYQTNFTNSMPDTNYSTFYNDWSWGVGYCDTLTTGSFVSQSLLNNFGAQDVAIIWLAVFR